MIDVIHFGFTDYEQATAKKLARRQVKRGRDIALRLDGIWSITEGIAALAHDIKGLLRWREPAEEQPSGR